MKLVPSQSLSRPVDSGTPREMVPDILVYCKERVVKNKGSRVRRLTGGPRS